MDADPRSKLRQQARGLAIGHLVSGLLIGTVGLMFLGHVAVGIAVLTGLLPLDGPNPAMDWLFGGVFLVTGTIAVATCELYAAISLYAAHCFVRSKHRTFLIATQALNLIHQPIGMVLGVLGLIWLFQDDVVQLFAEEATA